MADLVAVHNGLALFRSGDLGVIVDTEDLNPFDPQPYQRVFSQLPWEPADPANANPVWQELAESSFAISTKPKAKAVVAAGNIARVVRVPKNVQQTATKSMIRPDLSDSAQAIARSLASGSVTAATVMRMRNYFGTHSITASGANEFMAHGGRPGQAWADKTSRSLLSAAGENDDMAPVDLDPDSPHMFMPDAADPDVCAVCGLPAEDERHATEAGDDALGSTKYFGIIEEDNTTSFKLSSLFALDESGSWWERSLGEWEPAEAPDNASVLELDDHSFVLVQSQVDDPEIELAELSVTEENLHEWAAEALAQQGDMLDAIFAAAPYVDPAVRSENAKKQVRDADGKFIKMGARIRTDAGVSGTVKETNPDGTVQVETNDGIQVIDAGAVHRDEELPQEKGAPVARLPQPLELVTDVTGRIKSYLESQKDKRDPGAAASQFQDLPFGEPTDEEPAPGGSGPVPTPEDPIDTTVEPLYLAVVDNEDTQAVLDLLAIIPGDPASGASIEAYRRAEGAWQPASDMLQRLQGSTPPPIVELDAANLADVLKQMDPPAAATEPAPVAAAGLRRFEINENGVLVASIVDGPALLASYEEYPEDVVARLAEFATPESSDVDSPAANRLKRYWEHGEGAAKIRWGTDGDWTRCVRLLSKYMGPRAKGYCTLRHKGALGYYPGELDRPGNPKSGDRKGAFGTDVSPNLEEFSSQFADGDTEADPTVADADAPHEPIGDDPDAPCALCGRPWDDPIHTDFTATGEEGAAAVSADPIPPEPIDIHEFAPSDEDPTICAICGTGPDSDLHVSSESSETGASTFAHEDAVDPETGLAPEEPNWSDPHVFEQDDTLVTDEPKCICGQDPDAPIHIVVMPMPDDAVEGDEDEGLVNDELVDEDTGIVIVASAGVGGSARFRIPIVVPEGKESGDGRMFAADSLTSRDVPLALMWQIQSDEGHKQSVIVGRVDHVERLPEGGLGNAYGVFDDGEYGQEALRLVRGGMLRGISADLDEFEADVLEPAAENKIMSPKIEVKKGRLMGITLVAKPAFADCTIELIDGEDDEVADGEYEEQTPQTVTAAMVAAAAPVEPPKTWFENPKLSKPTPLTIDDEGRVFGHIATWETSHIGLPYGTRPPRSVTNYQYFRTGVVRTAEGDDVPVGQLTLAGGHAPLQADANAAVKHYDDTASAWADVAAGEDKHGIWVSGAIRPDITAAQIRVARASAPSGDWRPINGTLELVAACCVNVPGFPVARAMVAGGQITALVAAGTADLVMEKTFQDPSFKSMRDNFQALSRLVSSDKGEQARAKLEAARVARQETLVASAKARVDAVRQEREIAAQADAVRERMQALVAGLRYQPKFEEHKHPRDEQGRFRKVYARLMDALGADPDRNESRALTQATGALKEASDFERAGDDDAAKIAGEEAQAALNKAQDEVSEEIKSVVIRAAEEVGEVLARLASDPESTEGLAFADLPEEVKGLLKDFVDRIEQTADPLNIEQADKKIKAFVEGKGFRSPEEIASLIASYLKEKVKPNPITKGGPLTV